MANGWSARERLLKSMLDSIWERSFSAISVDAICERAGVHKGSFYHFFGSKTELAVAALEHLWATETEPTLDEIFADDWPPLERLLRLVDYWYEHSVQCQREHGKVLGCPYFHIAAETSSAEPVLTVCAREKLDRFQGYLEATLEAAVARGDLQIEDTAAMADGLFAMIEGCATQARIHNDPERVRHFAGIMGRALGVPGLGQRKQSA